MKIIVDADACPRTVFSICKKLGHCYGIQVWTVASFDHNIHSGHHVIVGNDSQETDIKILNMTEEGDIVVTQDWGLAAVVLGKGARSLSPAGREFRSERIEFLLEEREIKSKLRRRGRRTKGLRKRMVEDDRRFEISLERVLLRLSGGVMTGGTSS